MGAGLEMMALMRLSALICTAALALSACGTDPSVTAAAQPSKALIAAYFTKAKAKATLTTLDPATVLALRTVLEKDRQPILLVLNSSLKYSDLMAPYGSNGGVQTWASTSYTSLSTRDGVVVATRGFGPDLMSAVAPTLTTLSAARGPVQRTYYYLDGGDQRQVFQFDCTLAAAGPENITVLGKVFATRKTIESCSGASGRFTNTYWFDSAARLRQSQQFMAPGLEDLTVQRIVD